MQLMWYNTADITSFRCGGITSTHNVPVLLSVAAMCQSADIPNSARLCLEIDASHMCFITLYLTVTKFCSDSCAEARETDVRKQQTQRWLRRTVRLGRSCF